MDRSVWEPLAKERLEQYMQRKLLPIFVGCSCFPSSYLDICYSRLFDGYLEETKELLFSVPGCLGLTGESWEGVSHGFAPLDRLQGFIRKQGCFRYPTPRRHVRHFAEKCRVAYLTAFLVETCKCLPVRLPVNCRRSVLQDLEAKLLSQCFSQVQALSFFCVSWVDESKASKVFSLPRQVIEVVLATPHTVLRGLKLHGTTEFVRHVMDTVTGVLSPIATPESVASGLTTRAPYGGLSCIDIRLENESGLFTGEEEEVHDQLQSVVCHQVALTSLTLDQWDTNGRGEITPPRILQLYSWLGSLFHQPQFKELKLMNDIFNWDILKALLPTFLAAKSQEQEKILCLEQPYFQLDEPPTPLGPMATSACTASLSGGPPRKALILSGVAVTSDYSGSVGLVFTWLTSFRFSQFLSSFTFTSTCQDADPMDSDDFDDITAVFGINRALEMLAEQDERHEPIPMQFFEALFTPAPYLKSVSFRYHYLGLTHLLPAITEGLRVLESRELHSLNFEGCSLGHAEETDLLAFFDMLFALAQLSQLELNLTQNELKPQHFALMYRSWRKATAHSKITKQVKCLQVSGNEYEDHTSELQEIAASGDFLDF